MIDKPTRHVRTIIRKTIRSELLKPVREQFESDRTIATPFRNVSSDFSP